MQQRAEPGRCGAGGPAGSLASRTGLIWGGRLSTGAGEMSWLTALLADMEQTGRGGGGGGKERKKKKALTKQLSIEQETRPGRLMFISRGGSWAGRMQAASPSSGLLLRPAAAPEPRRRDFRSLPVPRRRAGASLQRAAGAGAALGCADNGGREGGGRADSTYLRGKRSRALPSKRLPDRRARKWRGRRGSPLLSLSPVPMRTAGTWPARTRG